MAYRRSRGTRSRRRSSRIRRRSRRASSRYKRNYSRSLRRYRSSKKAPKITVKHFRNLYPDCFMTKMKDNSIEPFIAARVAVDYNTLIESTSTARNILFVVLNANPNGGVWYQDPINPGSGTFNPNPSSFLESRYLSYRPLGAKVTITVRSKLTTDATNSGNAPQLIVTGFPYVANVTSGLVNPGTAQADANLANFWDQTATLGITPSNIPQLKYGWKRELQGKGDKSLAVFSKYYSFPKLLGLTTDQYMAYPVGTSDTLVSSVTASTGGSLNPTLSIRLAVVVADLMTSDATSNYAYTVKMTQYGRWETQKLLFE